MCVARGMSVVRSTRSDPRTSRCAERTGGARRWGGSRWSERVVGCPLGHCRRLCGPHPRSLSQRERDETSSARRAAPSPDRRPAIVFRNASPMGAAGRAAQSPTAATKSTSATPSTTQSPAGSRSDPIAARAPGSIVSALFRRDQRALRPHRCLDVVGGKAAATFSRPPRIPARDARSENRAGFQRAAAGRGPLVAPKADTHELKTRTPRRRRHSGSTDSATTS